MWSDGGCDPCRGLDVAGQLARAGAGELVAAPGGVCDTCGAASLAGEAIPEAILDRSRPKASGVVRLPSHIAWSPPYEYDLADRRWLRGAYQRILTEGTEADVLWYINIDVLLDRRARNEWKREDVEATAELVAARAAAW